MMAGGPVMHPQAGGERCRSVARTRELAPGHEFHRHAEEARKAARPEAGVLALDRPPHPLRPHVDAEHEVGKLGPGR